MGSGYSPPSSGSGLPTPIGSSGQVVTSNGAAAVWGSGTITSQSGTAYTFVADDAQTVVESTSGSATTFTIPPNSSVAFPIGTQIVCIQAGAGALTVAAGGGVTLHGSSLSATGQWGTVVVQQIAANTWVAVASGGGGGSSAGTLLGRCFYAPNPSVSYAVTASTLTALDATNLKVSFTTAASGPGSTEVLVKLQAGVSGTTILYFGLTGTGAPASRYEVLSNGSPVSGSVEFLVTGLTPNTAYTWDFAAATNTGTFNVYAGSGTGVAGGIFPALMKVIAGLS